METFSDTNQRQERLKKRRQTWPSWLCSPRSLRLLIGLGQIIALTVRVVIELVKVFRG